MSVSWHGPMDIELVLISEVGSKMGPQGKGTPSCLVMVQNRTRAARASGSFTCTSDPATAWHTEAGTRVNGGTPEEQSRRISNNGRAAM